MKQKLAQGEDEACLLRGIVVEAKTQVGEIGYTNRIEFRIGGEMPAANCWRGGLYFGDGSGGIFSKYPTIRRCGVGVAKMNKNTGDLDFACNFSLPRHVQIVARAEAHALQIVLEHVNSGEAVTFVTDNAFVYKIFYKGKDLAIRAVSGDLYELIFEDIRDRALRVEVLWMPSHTAIEEENKRAEEDDGDKGKGKGTQRRRAKKEIKLPDWCERVHITGNQHADRHAGYAARYAQLPNDITEPIVKHIDTTKRIQLRLASILCKLPHRPKYTIPKSMNVPKPSIYELLCNSRHDFRRDGQRAMCTKCYPNILKIE